MTKEQIKEATKLITALASFNCEGIKCEQCPFANEQGWCSIITARNNLKRLTEG